MLTGEKHTEIRKLRLEVFRIGSTLLLERLRNVRNYVNMWLTYTVDVLTDFFVRRKILPLSALWSTRTFFFFFVVIALVRRAQGADKII